MELHYNRFSCKYLVATLYKQICSTNFDLYSIELAFLEMKKIIRKLGIIYVHIYIQHLFDILLINSPRIKISLFFNKYMFLAIVMTMTHSYMYNAINITKA